MSDLTLEPAAHEDLAAIGRLLEELIAAVENDASFDSGHALQNCRTMMDDANSHMIVAKERRTVAGFISFTTRKTLLHSEPSGLVDELVVAENYRGRGIGHRLIEAAISKCKELGCSEIEVSTEKSNTAARRFYARCGFQEEAVLLELHLDEGD